MKTFGILSVLGGAACLGYAAVMDTAAPPSSILDDTRFLNLGLLQNQLMVWELGLTLLIAGAVLYAGGSLKEGGAMANPQAAPEAETDPEAPYTGTHAKGDETVVWIVVGLVGLVGAVWLIAEFWATLK